MLCPPTKLYRVWLGDMVVSDLTLRERNCRTKIGDKMATKISPVVIADALGNAKTKTKAPVSTALATVKAVELHRVLNDAVTFASRDETLPMVNIVHVEFTGAGFMLAVATDRFRLGVSKVDLGVNGAHDTASFNLAVRDVQTLIKLAKTVRPKTVRRDEQSRVVWINQIYDEAFDGVDPQVKRERLRGTVTFKFSDGASLDVVPVDVHFPKWRQLFPDTGTQVPRDATAFTAEYLASFAKVDGGASQRIVMYNHDSHHGYNSETQKNQRPTTFTIGDNFVGLLMPVKLADDGSRQWVKPVWMT